MGKIWDFLTAGTKHRGQHAAGGQRGQHAGGGKPSKAAKQQKREPKGKK